VAVFFPLRWVDYRSKYQVEPGAPKYNPRICQEKESDRAKLENFLQLLQQQGAPLDKEKIQFGWQKEVHPRDEWRSVRFSPFFPPPQHFTHDMSLVLNFCVFVKAVTILGETVYFVHSLE
jgi:hypothetical protein